MALRFGSGALEFEYAEGWERIPPGMRHFDVPSVCADSESNVFLFCRGKDPVMVYDRDGNFLDSWGHGRFSYRVHGLYMVNDAEILCTDDTGESVGRFTRDGMLLLSYGPSGVPSDTGFDGLSDQSIQRGGPPYNSPTNAAVSPTGDVYVSDGYGNSRVHQFNAHGAYVRSWGEPGSGHGEFLTPHSVWVHTDGRVFVCDRSNDRIQIFSPTGEFLTEWTDLYGPQDLYIDKDDVVYVGEQPRNKGSVSPRRGPVTEDEPARLSIFDIEGNVLLRWSNPDPASPGFLMSPHGITVDAEGSIFVGQNTETIGRALGFSAEERSQMAPMLKFIRV